MAAALLSTTWALTARRFIQYRKDSASINMALLPNAILSLINTVHSMLIMQYYFFLPFLEPLLDFVFVVPLFFFEKN